MAVLPTFDPQYQATGRTANQLIGGMEAGQSMMERQQTMRIREQRSNLEQAEFQAKLPVLQAAAQADLASANASIQNAARMEKLRTQAAAQSTPLNDEYLAALALPTFEEQARALSAMQPKVAYMDILPEYKGFVTAVNNATVKAHSSALVDRQLSNKIDQIDLRGQYQAEVGKVRTELEGKRTEDRFAHQREMEGLRQTGRVETEDMKIRTRSANKFNEEILGAASDARASLRDADRAVELLDAGVRTGTAANIETALRRSAVALGVAEADASVAKKEELDRILGDAVLRRVNQTKGAVSDKEMALFENYSASSTKTPEGNKAILTAYKRVQERKLKVAKMVNDLRRAGRSEAEIQNQVNDAILGSDAFDGLSIPGVEVTEETISTVAPAWSDAKEQRLLELKAKLGK